ncbi:MAG TPA: hypothetical protein VKB93_28620 [Thermoanaerobaculia bacterium]|nr:hypothetical protein [Thermoanaerobaculia bacterium]
MTKIQRAIHQPGVLLAERIARFETPFEFLKTARGGFDPSRRFILDKTLAGEPLALATRDQVLMVMRRTRLGDPLQSTRDLEAEFARQYDHEFGEFIQGQYPWMPAPVDGGDLNFEPHPDTDDLLDFHICEGLKDFGFDRKNRKAGRNYWRCHSNILPRRVSFELDKRSQFPGTKLYASLVVHSLPYSVPIGDPFFYSGGVFHTSRADDPAAPMKLFFDEYHRVFPHVIDALAQGIAAVEALK